MSLHLRYRLWIAEMNSDIDVLRIFGDYLKELVSKGDNPEVKNRIDYFQQQFINLRKDIDELRDEMHILKWNWQHYSKEAKLIIINYKTYQKDNHTVLKKRYFVLKENFADVREDFIHFEGKWLN